MKLPQDAYIAVGYDKGEMDFSVAATVCELSYDEMNELRVMIIVGIGTMEAMWRREQENRNPPAMKEEE